MAKKQKATEKPTYKKVFSTHFGQWNGLQIYEVGPDHILISKNGCCHIKLVENEGMIANYKWDSSKWVPQYRFEQTDWKSLITETDIFNFIKTHKQLW